MNKSINFLKMEVTGTEQVSKIIITDVIKNGGEWRFYHKWNFNINCCVINRRIVIIGIYVLQKLQQHFFTS